MPDSERKTTRPFDTGTAYEPSGSPAESYAFQAGQCASVRIVGNPTAAASRISVHMTWSPTVCLEVEVASQGKTPEEALENLKEALELYFEDAEPPEKLEPPIISTIELSA